MYEYNCLNFSETLSCEEMNGKTIKHVDIFCSSKKYCEARLRENKFAQIQFHKMKILFEREVVKPPSRSKICHS